MPLLLAHCPCRWAAWGKRGDVAHVVANVVHLHQIENGNDVVAATLSFLPSFRIIKNCHELVAASRAFSPSRRKLEESPVVSNTAFIKKKCIRKYTSGVK